MCPVSKPRQHHKSNMHDCETIHCRSDVTWITANAVARVELQHYISYSIVECWNTFSSNKRNKRQIRCCSTTHMFHFDKVNSTKNCIILLSNQDVKLSAICNGSRSLTDVRRLVWTEQRELGQVWLRT